MKTGRGADQFVLRLPPGMRDRIAKAAEENGRSMNAEFVSRIEKTLEDDESVAELWNKVERLEAAVAEHDVQLNPSRYLRED